MKSFKDLQENLKRNTDGFPVVSVSLLGDTATQFLAKAICGEGVDRGFQTDLFEAEYNQVERQVLDQSSDLYQFNARYCVVFQSTQKLLSQYSSLPSSAWGDIAEERIRFVGTLCQSVPGKIIYFNYPELGDGVFGNFENKVPSSFVYQIRKLNLGLMELAQQYANLFICDFSEIQSKFGRNVLFDSRLYYSAEMALSLDALPIIASNVWDIICSIEGKINKCLILDLDNTLWGGVVGDDGWEHIQIGHGIGIGKVYSEIQQWAKRLKNRGVILCVCSKNDEDKAKEPFQKNPEMVLKLDDISVFVANWENKADNIKMIQRVLNIGFDSMVFLDDNPFERNFVRESIPEITVPELPDDPGDYLEYLYSLNLFETASYSIADKDRTKFYQTEAKRVSAASSFVNEADFLKSLKMKCVVEGFTKYNIPRVAQLTQRSNQFNLTTVRYTEEDIERFSSDPKVVDLCFSLEDKFGDNGLIAVVIMRELDEDSLFIDTWLMSCRVLKRGMENFTINTIVSTAKSLGYRRIVGEFCPTKKNGMVKDLLPQMGFSPVSTDNAVYELGLSDYSEKENYIEQVR